MAKAKKKCASCKNTVPTNRHKYCTQCKGGKPAAPSYLCVDCGLPRENSRARLCSSCKHRRLPTWQQVEARASSLGPASKTVKNGKTCSICLETKALRDFPRLSSAPDGKQKYCTLCSNEKSFIARLKSQYNLTIDQYRELLDKQDGRCAICRNKPQRMRLAVDHDHKTGLVRGLLCTRCNHKLLGSAHDNVDLLRSAIDYLESPPAKHLGVVAPNRKPKKRKKRK